MMRTLIYKECVLSAILPTYLFMFFGAMLLIPNYPYTVPFFFGCLGLFFTVQNARENHDTFYTAMLPVKKKDVVTARCLFFVLVQTVEILIAIPFALIRNSFYPEANAAGLSPGVAFFGLVFIQLAIFNSVFLITFYKTAYKAGKSFVITQIPLWIFMGICEGAAHIPALSPWLSANPGDQLRQLPILAGGLVIYIIANVIACKVAAARFEKVDL